MTDWKEYTISDIAILNYGKSLTDNNREAGTVPVYGSGGIIGYHSKAIVNSGLIIGRKGTVGSLFMEKKPFFPIDTVYFIDKLIDEKKQDLTFFFYLM